MHEVCVTLQDIGKEFRSGRRRQKPKTLFTGINLEIKKGETWGIMGASGVGKTTLGKIIAGLERPTFGKVIYRGKDIASLDKKERRTYRRSVQVLFQDPQGSFNPRKTIGRSLNDVLKLIAYPEEGRGEVIARCLSEVGLNDEIIDRYPDQLSGGMNQRAALARILLLEPGLIVLDEPTSALDLTVQAQILCLLKDVQKNKNLSYVFISHDEAVIDFMSRSKIILKRD